MPSLPARPRLPSGLLHLARKRAPAAQLRERGSGRQLVLGRLYNAAEFLDVASYKNVLAWAERIDARPAVKRGRMVNRMMGDPSEQLHERHSAEDFETKTQDKIAEDAA